MMKKFALGLLVLAFLTTAPSGNAQSQVFPTMPIRMIVGFAPGGPTDLVARVMADKLSEELGQPVLIDNKPGAAGNIAAELVAKAAPDGHTLLYASSAIAISPALYEKLSFDVERDFVPITETVTVPMVLLVHPSFPAKTAQDLVEYGRKNPGSLNYGSSGAGTITHLAAALFVAQNGFVAQHIPYKGTAPTLTDLLAGRIQFTVGTINTALPHIREGKLRPLAVTSMTRSDTLPQVPTLDEAGFKGFEASAWQGVAAPAGTSAKVVQRLQSAIAKTLSKPEIKARLAAQDAVVLATGQQEFTAYLKSELRKWGKVVKDTGAKAD